MSLITKRLQFHESWTLLIRLFLGVTFVYAGIEKITDPQFFNPSATGYIGQQLSGMAQNSPLGFFLLQVAVPNAMLFGMMVIAGELCIGIGTIFGFLSRPAALFGFIINVTFLLTASWGTKPFFYGADIMYMAAWTVLFLVNPANAGFLSHPGWHLSVDSYIVKKLALSREDDEQSMVTTFLFGTEPRQRLFLVSTIPLRLFLGFIFIYAGIYQYMLSSFLDPATGDFIGKQLSQNAPSSPIGSLLVALVPNASSVGMILVIAEIAIGVCTLFGLFARPAAFGGLLINTITWLIVSFGTYPYFLAGDTMLMVCWLTLCISPLNLSALPTIDGIFVDSFLNIYDELPRLVVILFGGTTEPKYVLQSRSKSERAIQEGRRTLIGNLATMSMIFPFLTLAVQVVLSNNTLASLLGMQQGASHSFGSQSVPPATGAIPTPGAPPPTVPSIASPSKIPLNSAINFIDQNIPGNTALLVHLQNNNFVAYSAVCTHQGCTLSGKDYNANAQHIICPCHNATFDPANNAAVVSGPARRPLPSVPITVNIANDTIMLA